MEWSPIPHPLPWLESCMCTFPGKRMVRNAPGDGEKRRRRSMENPETSIVLGLLVVLAASTVLAAIMDKIKFPAILGQILAGVVVGNAVSEGSSVAAALHSETLTLFGAVGIVFLMFKSGLEAKPDDIKKNLVGASLVAGLGVAFVGLLGYGVARMMLPTGSHWLAYVYCAAALTPTSAGIGAAIFGAKKQSGSSEGITVLVAAVLDDVIGLVVMAVLGALAAGVTSGKPLEYGPLGLEALKGVGFVGLGFLLGVWIIPRYLKGALKIKNHATLMGGAVSVCLLLAYLGTFAGLAPLIGGYVAGLVFEQVRYREQEEGQEEKVFELEHAVDPLVQVLSPVFFFLLGSKVALSALAQPSVIGLAVALTAVTIVGKIFASVGVVNKQTRKWPVVWGMMPRGEVAAIMVTMGASLSVGGAPLISKEVTAAFVAMIALTTLVAIVGLNKTLPPAPEVHA